MSLEALLSVYVLYLQSWAVAS